MTPFEVSNVIQIILLSMALPLSLIAVKGYWGTLWGRVIRPLPIIEVGFISSQVLALFDLHSRFATLSLLLVVVTTLAAVVSGINLFRLLRNQGGPA